MYDGSIISLATIFLITAVLIVGASVYLIMNDPLLK